MSRPEALVEFTRGLRGEGIPAGPATAGDLLQALETVGAASAADVYWAFRSICTTSLEQAPAFDRVFLEVFGDQANRIDEIVFTSPRSWSIRGGGEEGGEGEGSEELPAVTGASELERLSGRDFAELTAAEESQVRTLIAQMVWNPARVRSRRRKPERGGDRPDLRRTLRKAIGPSGDLLLLETTARSERRRPLVFIADVSGSMERYSEMLLYFAHATRGLLGRVEAFVFSTRLTRITRELSRRRPSEAIAMVAESVEDWSGGTRIGAAIRTYNREWSRRVSRGGPIVVVISDGWDRGDPDVLHREMGALARSSHRVVWLNPLAGRPGFAPETRGMRAALPHVDDFLPAANLRDLETLVSLLESIPAMRSRR